MINFKMISRWQICVLLLFWQRKVDCKSCPTYCKCQFSDILQDNRGTCTVNNSSIDITWEKDDFGRPALFITCHGLNYSCANLPQFNISHDKALAYISFCSTNILRCVNGIYSQPTIVEIIKTYDMIGSYTIEDFEGLTQVKKLRLDLPDNVTEIPMDILNLFPLMKSVDIVGGNLQLYSNMFNNTHIDRIGLYDNNINNIPSYTFNGTELIYLEINNNNMEVIKAGAFKGLDVLETLLIIKNKKLKLIEPELFNERRKLQVMSLEENGEELFTTRLISLKNNLVQIDLTSKLFNYLPRSLWSLQLDKCKITSLPEDIFEGSSGLMEIAITNNIIGTLSPKVFFPTTALRVINLENNKIEMIPEGIFSKSKELEIVSLRYNNIKVLSGNIFASNPRLVNVWLDTNSIKILDLNAFNAAKFNIISLVSNQIQSIVSNISLSYTIQELDLTDNNISVIPEWLLSTEIMSLNLTRNKIKSIKESYSNVPYKMQIDLRYNNISHVISDNLNTLVSERNSRLHINLSNNSWECDCSVTTILNEWHKDGVLLDFNDIICSDDEKLSEINVFTLCNKSHALIAHIGSSAVGALIIIIFVLLLFTRRKKIWQNISNILIRETDSYNNKITAYQIKLDANKPHDVFISFAHQDGEFVASELLPKLENDYGQNVCVHYRDWIVGDLIPDQIILSVEGSRKTIIILTEHFLASEWSYLEFRTAHNLSIQEGKPKVIIIVLDEAVIRNKKMFPDLKSYIVINNYLLWGDSNFWKKLQKLLPRQGKKQKSRQ